MTHEVRELPGNLVWSGLELDDGSTSHSLTTGATSLASALRAPSAVV